MGRDCYGKHGVPAEQHFPCYDGESTVCPRCCVAACRAESPDWFAACAAAGHPTWPAVAGGLPRKLVCLEASWDRRVFHMTSVRGFFGALSPLIHPPLRVAYRFIESAKHLAHYTRRPRGVLWTDPEAFDAPIFYVAFHGGPGAVRLPLDQVGPDLFCEAFRGYGGYDNLIYLAACTVLRGQKGTAFGRRLLRASGTRAVIGYATDVDWMHSLVVDLLFLYRFSTHPDPWPNLAQISASVRRDFGPARAMGYTLLEAEGGRTKARARRLGSHQMATT